MTHLKELFYQDYFSFSATRRDDKGKPAADPSKINEANSKLLGYRFDSRHFSILDLEKAGKQLTKINLITTYPGLFTGSGYMHETGAEGEFKLGFYFDHTTGLPIIPGHSIKGTLRSLFPSFKPSADDYLTIAEQQDEISINKAEFIASLFSLGENKAKLVHHLELDIFEGIDIAKTLEKRQVLGKEGSNTLCYLPMSQHDQFLDAFIYDSFNTGKKILGNDAITPHGDNALKNPIPLPFLKVLPQVGFTFPFVLHDSALGNEEGLNINAEKKREAFESILLTIGIGAKTNVGYGQFVSEQEFANKQKGDSKSRASDRETNVNKENKEVKDNDKSRTLQEIESKLPYYKLKSDERFGRVLDPKPNRNGKFANTKRLYFLPDGREFTSYRSDDLNSYERKTILKVRITKNLQNTKELSKIEVIEQIFPSK